ncbi:hypothetical protein PVK06_044200 [Gossypium arboreum]|uniref:Uncharacterized protein n=1 Tax=Gossypium arboreum TaxID=29729 RepID=A0ABR0MQI8_GOSAR|nr:hypothetical protein PVK06_044200 [Gossypium arboreum]
MKTVRGQHMFKFERQKRKRKLSVQRHGCADDNREFDTPAQHSVSSFDFNFERLMFYAKNTYSGMASSSTSGKSAGDFGCTDNYTRRDYILSTTSTSEGTSNHGHAKGIEIEEDIELDKDPIWESGSNDLEIALFSELKPIPT